MIEERIKYWKKQIELLGKQSIYRADIRLIEETVKELQDEIQRLETELMVSR